MIFFFEYVKYLGHLIFFWFAIKKISAGKLDEDYFIVYDTWYKISSMI